MSMNINSVNNLDAAIGVLGGIKGNVTESQISDLTSLFSANFWNTSDKAGTTQTIERQMRELEMLIDEIEAEIEALYDQQKAENDKMSSLINNMNEESYQATKQAQKNVKEQQEAVTKATDEAYKKYMKGEIEKDEIPMYIASALKKTDSSGGAALENHLSKMDSWGQSITSLSNKISTILDSVNEYTSQLETTKTSLDLLAKIKAQIPEHKDRADIEQNVAQPYFSPSQEALGDKAIDAFKVANKGTWADGDESTTLMKDALGGTAEINDARKAEIDAMSPEEKAAAVEGADFEKYSIAELFYMSGMDAQQAACAFGNVFRGAGVGYNTENGAMVVPYGHDAIGNIYTDLINQFETFWPDGAVERGSMTDGGNKGGADPIGWRDGDTNYMFAVDRDNDNKFDGAEEFLGYENGWNELAAFDTDGDGTLTAAEAEAGGLRVVDVDQSLTDGGTYGFNGVKESGFESINLSTFKEVDDVKSTNLNGNERAGEFEIVVNGETLTGKQTNNTEAYNEAFYGHMGGEAYTFGLDPTEVADALREAANPEDYTAMQKEAAAAKDKAAQATIETDAETMQNYAEKEKEIAADAATTTGDGLEPEEKKDADEETGTNTNDTTASTTTTTTTTTASTETDPYVPKT